ERGQAGERLPGKLRALPAIRRAGHDLGLAERAHALPQGPLVVGQPVPGEERVRGQTTTLQGRILHAVTTPPSTYGSSRTNASTSAGSSTRKTMAAPVGGLPSAPPMSTLPSRFRRPITS